MFVCLIIQLVQCREWGEAGGGGVRGGRLALSAKQEEEGEYIQHTTLQSFDQHSEVS